jgi:hypothetical protein
VSSASTTAAAATMAMHGKLSPDVDSDGVCVHRQRAGEPATGPEAIAQQANYPHSRGDFTPAGGGGACSSCGSSGIPLSEDGQSRKTRLTRVVDCSKQIVLNRVLERRGVVRSMSCLNNCPSVD